MDKIIDNIINRYKKMILDDLINAYITKGNSGYDSNEDECSYSHCKFLKFPSSDGREPVKLFVPNELQHKRI